MKCPGRVPPARSTGWGGGQAAPQGGPRTTAEGRAGDAHHRGGYGVAQPPPRAGDDGQMV